MPTWIVPSARRRLSPNIYPEGHKWIRPVEFLTVHFTTGPKTKRGTPTAVRTLTDPLRKASAHFVLNDPEVWQLAPLEARCWHAGGKSSRWRGKTCNVRSIGIEVCNFGLLFERPDRGLESWWSKEALEGIATVQISFSEYERRFGSQAAAIVRRLYARKAYAVPDTLNFEAYNASQVQALAMLIQDLADRFPVLRDGAPDRLVSHEELDPARKIDTGPALRWRLDRWRDELAAGKPLSFPPNK